MELNPSKNRTENGGKGKGFLSVKGLIVYVITGLITFAALYAYNYSSNGIMRDLIIAVDKFGITEVASAEKRRVALIKQLNIPFEKKLVLMKRNVFMGAKREMVQLALGNPRMAGKSQGKNGGQVEQWIYYLAHDNRPTILEFSNNELISAYRGSNIDFQFARR